MANGTTQYVQASKTSCKCYLLTPPKEKITAPSVQDEVEVTKYFDAAAALLAASQTGKPAPRYTNQ
jgi:hypothetical protein